MENSEPVVIPTPSVEPIIIIIDDPCSRPLPPDEGLTPEKLRIIREKLNHYESTRD